MRSKLYYSTTSLRLAEQRAARTAGKVEHFLRVLLIFIHHMELHAVKSNHLVASEELVLVVPWNRDT
jgi:hypothetical protein